MLGRRARAEVGSHPDPCPPRASDVAAPPRRQERRRASARIVCPCACCCLRMQLSERFASVPERCMTRKRALAG